MKLALCLFKYFPYGGLQRNFLAIATELLARGHQVKVYASLWEGDQKPELDIELLPVSGMTNHGKNRQFYQRFAKALAASPVDLVIGFNKMPGLDLYYAADSCFAYKAYRERGWLYRQPPRSRISLEYEEAVFGQGSKTEILEVSVNERQRFIEHYGLAEQRFHTLPPGISPNRKAADNYQKQRLDCRRQLGFNDDQVLLLALGSGFRTKGVDRSIRVLAELNQHVGRDAHLLVVGQDKPDSFQRIAKNLSVDNRVHFLGGRDDVPALLQAADVLLHPAYKENTGNALLESMIAGTPVVATDVCGYAHYIVSAELGQVVSEPYDIRTIAEAVNELLAVDSDEWHRRGIAFSASSDIYSRPQRAADIIEQVWEKKSDC